MHDSLIHFLVDKFFNKNFKVNLQLRDLALIFLEYSFIKSKSYIETIFILLGSIYSMHFNPIHDFCCGDIRSVIR